MLLPDHARFHDMGPKDVGIKDTMMLDVARTTNQTGEQFHFAIPVYPDDSREMLKDRIGMCLSIIQDRMEEENKAVALLNDKQQRVRFALETIKRNQQRFVNQTKALEKELKRKKLDQAEYEAKLAELKAGLESANKTFEQELKAEGEVAPTELPEASAEGPDGVAQEA